MNLPLSRVAQFISAAGDFDHEQFATGYSIDSRTIESGDLFFAVKGENHDGHDFVLSALGKGACAAVVSEAKAESFADRKNLLIVKDVLLALQTLGAAVRRVW